MIIQHTPRQQGKTFQQGCIKIATKLSENYPISFEESWGWVLGYLQKGNLDISYEKVEQEYLKRTKGEIMIIDISEIYAMDILVGDILYSIPNDLFYKITRVVKEDWITLYTDTDTGEFSWGLNKTERLNKYEFRLYRKRILPYEQQ